MQIKMYNLSNLFVIFGGGREPKRADGPPGVPGEPSFLFLSKRKRAHGSLSGPPSSLGNSALAVSGAHNFGRRFSKVPEKPAGKSKTNT